MRRLRERQAKERAERFAAAVAEAGGQGTKGALRELRRINQERLRFVLAKVDAVIAEIDEQREAS